MRPPCLDCTYKHIANAAVFDTEISMGYPGFLMYCIGHLDHAAQEVQGLHQMFAWVLREHRIRRFSDPAYQVPYEALAGYCWTLDQLNHDDWPEIPESCLVGLDREASGKVKFSMDTRP